MPDGRKPEYSKLVSNVCGAVLFGALSFGFGLRSGAQKDPIYSFLEETWSDASDIAKRYSSGREPTDFLQPSRKPGSGVTVNKRAADGSLVLLSCFFDGGNELRLIRRDGRAVARWPLRYSKHFPDPRHLEKPPATDLNVDTHGALIRPDGSVVFNYEYSGTVKLSRCGEVVWTLAHPTHHSIVASESGGYWALGRRTHHMSKGPGFPPFTRMSTKRGYPEDLILKVTESGKIVGQASIPRILYDNGLEPLMTATGYRFDWWKRWQRELVHANKVGELSAQLAGQFQAFSAGDLVVSLRDYNLIFVVDPTDWRVKWHKTGPWRRQHDPEFRSNGTIGVFNNNLYANDFPLAPVPNVPKSRQSNIIEVDPSTGHTRVVYGGRKNQALLTKYRGTIDVTLDRGYLISEFEGGRAFEIDAQGRIVWEYINRYDKNRVLEITEARIYRRSYFSVKDWSCSKKVAQQ